MIQIIIAKKEEHAQLKRELFWEYFQWTNANVERDFSVSFDIVSMLEDDMNSLDKFMSPKGRLLLGYMGDQQAGIACLKALTDGIGKVKRMDVSPQARKQGLGHALLNRLPEESQEMTGGYDNFANGIRVCIYMILKT